MNAVLFRRFACRPAAFLSVCGGQPEREAITWFPSSRTFCKTNKKCSAEFVSKTQQSILFGYLIPTRQNKSQSKQFCIGDLTLFGLIWSQLSISHRVSDFLLSKFYQGVIANGLENRVQASCHQSSLQFYHKVEQDASCKAKRYVSRVILRAVVQDSYCGHSRVQLRHSDHAM